MVEVEYRRQGKAMQRIKRRIDLLGAGVSLHQELAVDRVRRTVMDYTLLSRRLGEGEAGISAIKGKREGVPASDVERGISRNYLRLYTTEEGYEMVDVYSSVDTYLTSAVVEQDMSVRSILRHLGLARKLSDSTDRMVLEVEEQIYWREILPMIVRSGGYGMLYLSPAKEGENPIGSDSLTVKGKRYEVEEDGDYVFVGMDRADKSFRHVFASGGEYLFSLVCYGGEKVDGRATLQTLGLDVADSTE